MDEGHHSVPSKQYTVPPPGADTMMGCVEAGIERHLDILDGLVGVAPGKDLRDRSIATLSTMVGALLLSRAVDDRQLSRRILQAAAKELQMHEAAGDAQQGSLQ